MPAVVTMPMMPAVPMTVVPMTVVMMPAHFGGRLLGIRLDRCDRAGITQRQRLCLFGRSREHKTCAERSKPKNFRAKNLQAKDLRCVHINPPSMTGCHVSAARLIVDDHRFAATLAESRVSDVNEN
jgi:hypothetical protein